MMLQQTPLEHDDGFDAPPPERVIPHNIEAEQALLGAILMNAEAIDYVSDFLEPHHFFDPLHARIYESARQMFAAGKRVTPITLKPFFENEEPLGALTVPQYLGRLAANATTIINAKDYGRTIYDLCVRRNLIALGADMVNTAYDSRVDNPPAAQIEEAEAALFQLGQRGKTGREVSIGGAAVSAMDRIASAYEKGGEGVYGLSTGLKALDKLIGGLQKSDLIILAGRPSMGKTALALDIADNISAAGTPVGFYSLEMSSDQLAARLLSKRSEISSTAMRHGTISEAEFERLNAQTLKLKDICLRIDDTGGITIGQLSSRARRMVRQHKIGALFVDYLQLLSGDKKTRGRVEDITAITVGLKALAKELNIPIVALSQLSRQVENREDKRPLLSDLRESGSIEQDADIVLFVYREEYYLSRREPAESKIQEHVDWENEMLAVANRAEVIAGKQRHGPIGTAHLQFESKFTRFKDI